MKKFYIFLFLISLILISCQEDYEVEEEPTLVVEGWIDSGDYPVVMVSTTVPISSERHSLSDLGDCIVQWARVSISDGEREVVLTGKVDRHYMLPYIYTTGELCGEAGKTYTLHVDYEDFHATAVTTIPQPVDVDSIRVRRCQEDVSLFSIDAYFHDDPTERNYYKFFSSVGQDSRMFLSSYIQTINDQVIHQGEEVCVSVFRGRQTFNQPDYTPYYSFTDKVRVKFAQIDSTSYEFWNQEEHNVTLSRLPMASSHMNPAYNVQGAIGYWCGYGSRVYPVSIRDSVARGRVTL